MRYKFLWAVAVAVLPLAICGNVLGDTLELAPDSSDSVVSSGSPVSSEAGVSEASDVIASSGEGIVSSAIVESSSATDSTKSVKVESSSATDSTKSVKVESSSSKISQGAIAKSSTSSSSIASSSSSSEASSSSAESSSSSVSSASTIASSSSEDDFDPHEVYYFNAGVESSSSFEIIPAEFTEADSSEDDINPHEVYFFDAGVNPSAPKESIDEKPAAKDSPEDSSVNPHEVYSYKVNLDMPVKEDTSKSPDSPSEGGTRGHFLGVKNYGKIRRKEVLADSSEIYLFRVDGDTFAYSIENPDGKFPLHNTLEEGAIYDLTLTDNHIVDLERIDKPNIDFEPVVKPVPGKKTLKNLIATSLSPVGTVLYVYGGGWNFQDGGSSNQARTIGVSDSWVKFYDENGKDFSYKDPHDLKHTTYPFGGWNEYYYAGLDCSGYMGWVLYNTLYDKSLENPGFVTYAYKMAKALDTDYGFGTWTHPASRDKIEFHTGDIVSLIGHVYLVLGVCEDGSIVIVHCSPLLNERGYKGGGVMISPMNPRNMDNKDCDAFRLVDKYMKKFYPEWEYNTVMRPYKAYTTFSSYLPSTGVFHWNLENGASISDPDGYANMNAEEILKDLYGEI